MIDYAANTMAISAGFKKILGLDAATTSIALDKVIQFMHPDDKAHFFAQQNRAIRERGTLRIHYRIYCPDGSIHHIKALSSFRYDAAGTVTQSINNIMDVTEDVQATARTQLVPGEDRLIDLPNRDAFLKQLEIELTAARQSHTPLAVLVIDVDNFAKLNESVGHSECDEILHEVARRLYHFSPNVYSARIGGDRFGCLLTNIDDEVALQELIHKIHAAISYLPPMGEHAIRATCGSGLSIFPDDGEDLLFQKADMALYRAKREGRGILCRYRPELEYVITNQYRLERDLHTALAKKQFRIFYQAVVDATTHRIVGAEALLRWQHPEMGLLSSASFLNNLEDTGIIIDVGEWMLPIVCADLASLQQVCSDPIRLSINLSAQQLFSRRLVRRVGSALKASGIVPSSLAFELTEQTLIHDMSKAAKILKRLHELGTYISIDDFGTGHNTLTHVKMFPINGLKIDRLFVHDLPLDKFSKAICVGIADLGRALDLCVLGEGVETKGQSDFLESIGCQELQGFLFGKPLPRDTFIARNFMEATQRPGISDETRARLSAAKMGHTVSAETRAKMSTAQTGRLEEKSYRQRRAQK